MAADMATSFRWHFDKALALTGCVSFAGIAGCFAIVVTLALVNAVTFDIITRASHF
jgi:hypothetical protein